MKEVRIGPHSLICGDALEVLPKLESGSVDAVMTSPPYNTLPQKYSPSGLHGERLNGVNKWIQKAVNSYADARPETEYQHWLAYIVAACLRVSRGLVWINHKVRYRDGEALHPVRFLPFPIYSEVIWNRRGSMALNCKRYAPSHESLWAFGKPQVWNDELNTLLSVWNLGFDMDDNGHPCAFPIEIAERPILSSTNKGGEVLDPFMGSGTTIVACQKTGRVGIGIEKDERYFEIACRRVESAVNSTPLFEPPVERQEVLL